MKLISLTIALLCALSVASIIDEESHNKRTLNTASTHNDKLKTSGRDEADQDLIAVSGFTNVVNNGIDTFRPILPGVYVPSARDENEDGNGDHDDDDHGDKGDDESNEAESSPSDDPVCFPADAYVETQFGSKKRIDQVNIGDRLHVGNGQFSTVFMFTHKLSQVEAAFVKLETDAGFSIRLTSGHYLYVNDRLASAETVNSGDVLILADGQRTVVSNVSQVTSRGLYNPQTVHGNIVVDGIVASTYTRAVQPTTAHALLAPLRALYQRLGLTTAYFDHGADTLANVVPSGSQFV